MLFALAAASVVKFYNHNLYLNPLSPPGDYKIERQEQFKKEIVKYDIVCLQEVWSFNDQVKQLRDDLVNHARSNGFKWVVIGPQKKDGEVADSGLVILSRYEIKEYDAIVYAKATGIETLASKGALYVKIAIDSLILDVVTTHMQAGNSTMDSTTRKEQVMELKSFINEKTSESSKVIVAGDFNIDSINSISEYNELASTLKLQDALFDQLREHPTTYVPWSARFNNLTSYSASLDYIFTSNVNGTTSVVSTRYNTPWKELSDHYGILYEIEVGDINSSPPQVEGRLVIYGEEDEENLQSLASIAILDYFFYFLLCFQ